MKSIFGLLFGLCAALSFATDISTPTGIPVNSAWKVELYNFARENVKHPAWGIAHSERDYQLSKSILELAGLPYDEEVLFAAAFMHDLGGIGDFAQPNVDHAVRSAELFDEKYAGFGFPAEKVASVKELILGHTYYGPRPSSAFAFSFRDADILDFLGAMGIARLYGATKDLDPTYSSLVPATTTIKKFEETMPGLLTLPASKTFLDPKLQEMKDFLRALDASSYQGKAL